MPDKTGNAKLGAETSLPVPENIFKTFDVFLQHLISVSKDWGIAID